MGIKCRKYTCKKHASYTFKVRGGCVQITAIFSYWQLHHNIYKFWGGGGAGPPPPLYETLLPDPYPSYRQERLRDSYDSTPDPGSSCLRCSTQKQTATWLLYPVLYSLLAAVVSAISLTLAPCTMPSFTGWASGSEPT